MSKNNELKIALVLFAIVALTTAIPAGDKVPTSGYPDNPPTIDLPFLQFKNGGIRVNFAGYHAEAGLGGLLGGSDAKGGLFASAGTPWGPSASAGLGGALGGEDGTASGGLHARAGLGNGGPEAVAGLGGKLDGSGRSGSRARGRLYAGATAGGPQAVAGLGGSIDESGGKTGSSYAAATDGQKTKVVVKDIGNIQSIAPPATGDKVYLAKSGPKEPPTTLEFKLPAVVSSRLVAKEVGNSRSKYDDVDGAVAISDVQDNADVSYPSHRYYRRRLRGNSPARKNALYKLFSTNTGTTANVVPSASLNHVGRIVERQTNDDRPNVDPPYGLATRTRSTTLFDDIFNIPISTLAAVNQLLNNKSG